MGPPLAISLAALVLSDSALRAFTASLQVVVVSGFIAAIPSPSPYAPTVKFATLSLLHPRFAFRVAVDGYLLPICEVFAQG